MSLRNTNTALYCTVQYSMDLHSDTVNNESANESWKGQPARCAYVGMRSNAERGYSI